MSVSSSNADSMDVQTGHWHQLVILLKQAPGTASSLLYRPPPPGIPSGDQLACLKSSAGRYGLSELLEKHLFSGFLLTPSRQRNQWPRAVRDIGKELFAGTDQEIFLAAPWIHVPVLTVQGTAGRIISMMIGLLQDGTECHVLSPPAPDEETIQAVYRSCRIAGRDKGFCYWFLLGGDEQSVSGRSLALPVALALDFVARSVAWPNGLYATGGLAMDGRILQVGGIRKKYKTIACSRHLFLTPADVVLHHKHEHLIHACATLEDALLAARLYSNGATVENIALCQACRISIDTFFNHVHELPQAFLQSDKADTFFHQAAAAPETYLNQLTGCFRKCAHDRQRGQRLAELFTPETILAQAGRSPTLDFAAFNWCRTAVAFHNHQGQVRKSRRWSKCARNLYECVDQEEIVKAVNHGFVCSRFNRYDFRPEFSPELAAILDKEEKQQQDYPTSNFQLGALYGTLAQNCGFCGSAHFTDLQAMIEKAQQAFGRRYHREKERLLNYEIYGCLDCGNLEQAEKLTAKYLGLATAFEPDVWWHRIAMLLTEPDVSSSFKAALALRLLDETGCLVSLSRLKGILPIIWKHHDHPWQMISLNLGRMAVRFGGPDYAAELHRHCLSICLADSDTMRPMALLALAELHKAGYAQPEEYGQALEISRWIERTDSLNGEHFQAILGMKSETELLQEVDRQRARLFPFSYR